MKAAARAVSWLTLCLSLDWLIYPLLKFAGVMKHFSDGSEPTEWPTRVLYLVSLDEYRFSHSPQHLAILLHVLNRLLMALLFLACLWQSSYLFRKKKP